MSTLKAKQLQHLAGGFKKDLATKKNMIGWIKLNAQFFLAPNTLVGYIAMLASFRVLNYVNISKHFEPVCLAGPPTGSTA